MSCLVKNYNKYFKLQIDISFPCGVTEEEIKANGDTEVN